MCAPTHIVAPLSNVVTHLTELALEDLPSIPEPLSPIESGDEEDKIDDASDEDEGSLDSGVKSREETKNRKKTQKNKTDVPSIVVTSADRSEVEGAKSNVRNRRKRSRPEH